MAISGRVYSILPDLQSETLPLRLSFLATLFLFGPNVAEENIQNRTDGEVQQQPPIEFAHADVEPAGSDLRKSVVQNRWQQWGECKIDQIAHNHGRQRTLEVAQEHPYMF